MQSSTASCIAAFTFAAFAAFAAFAVFAASAAFAAFPTLPPTAFAVAIAFAAFAPVTSTPAAFATVFAAPGTSGSGAEASTALAGSAPLASAAATSLAITCASPTNPPPLGTAVTVQWLVVRFQQLGHRRHIDRQEHIDWEPLGWRLFESLLVRIQHLVRMLPRELPQGASQLQRLLVQRLV